MKKMIVVLISFILISPLSSFAKQQGKKQQRKPGVSHYKEHHVKKMEHKIEKQHERKIQKLKSWKTKKTEKCGTDQACLDRVNKVYTQKQEQIAKQKEKREEALDKFKEKQLEKTFPEQSAP